jgi:hypothetical protein
VGTFPLYGLVETRPTAVGGTGHVGEEIVAMVAASLQFMDVPIMAEAFVLAVGGSGALSITDRGAPVAARSRCADIRCRAARWPRHHGTGAHI